MDSFYGTADSQFVHGDGCTKGDNIDATKVGKQRSQGLQEGSSISDRRTSMYVCCRCQI